MHRKNNIIPPKEPTRLPPSRFFYARTLLGLRPRSMLGLRPRAHKLQLQKQRQLTLSFTTNYNYNYKSNYNYGKEPSALFLPKSNYNYRVSTRRTDSRAEVFWGGTFLHESRAPRRTRAQPPNRVAGRLRRDIFRQHAKGESRSECALRRGGTSLSHIAISAEPSASFYHHPNATSLRLNCRGISSGLSRALYWVGPLYQQVGSWLVPRLRPLAGCGLFDPTTGH